MHRHIPSAILPLVAWPLLFLGPVACADEPAADELPPDHAQRMAKGLEMFDGSVRELLKKHCVACHGGDKTRGNFDLATREGLLKGGDTGKAIKPFRSADSLLVKLITHAEEPAMPDESPKLPDEEIRAIVDWIDHGAPYSGPLVEGKRPPRDGSIVTDEDRAWWSFQPLVNPALPPVEESLPKDWNEIDRFIHATAAKHGQRIAPAADKRKLIRRASFDLLGVPPTPEAVAAFVMDEAPDAWAKAVDAMLADSRYGERQARRWLDVARFAESAGFEHDYDRPGAWAYRDFVIRAFNAGMPYDQFVKWQIAGDELAPGDGQAMTATGFLGAGVFPTQITANEVERTRYDAMDDMLSTTGSAFLGLTIGCARCHDHKFDPIPTRDYYRLLSTFTTTVRSNVDVDLDPAKTAQLSAAWEAEHRPLVEELVGVEAGIGPEFDAWLAAGADPGPMATWRVLELDSITSKANATFQKLDDGSYLVSGTNETQDEYTLVSRSKSRNVTGLKLDALAHPSMVRGGPGRAANGNFALSRIRLFARALDAEGKPQGEPAEIKLVNPQVTFQQNDKNLSIAASLDEDQSSGWAVDPQIGKDHAAAFSVEKPIDHEHGIELKVVLAFRVNAQHNLGRPRVSIVTDVEPKLDGESMPAPVAEALAAAKTGVASLNEVQRNTLRSWFKGRHPKWKAAQGAVDAHLLAKPKNTTNVLICGEGHPPMRHHTQGADFFNETHILERGSTDRKKEVAAQGFLQVLMRAPEGEKLWPAKPTPNGKASGRRTALAEWIVDMDRGAGPLAARTMANRLWQWRLGTGLVASPNDLGRTGAKPTHPELLDWLAARLVAEKWNVKSLDRLILASATYRQSSLEAPPPPGDAGELFVGRKPRRLEAEALRDAMLAVSGELDPTQFGPGTLDESSRRRSVYFTMKRSQLVGSMVVFDQPEPLVSQGSRPTTTVAPQALLVLNGPQVRRWAIAMANRVAASAPIAESFDGAVRRVFLTAVAREPSRDELADATAFLQQQAASYQSENRGDARQMALADFCQAVFGLNEFAYVE